VYKIHIFHRNKVFLCYNEFDESCLKMIEMNIFRGKESNSVSA
jgi:hypothetical protein